MLNSRTLVIIKRELQTRLLSKSFVLMTVSIPILLFIIIGIQGFLMNYESDKGTNLRIVSVNTAILEKVKKSFDGKNFQKENNYNIMIDSLSGESLESYWKKYKGELLSNKLNGIIFIPDSSLRVGQNSKEKLLIYYSSNPKNFTILSKIKGPLNEALVDNYFKDKSLSKEDISYARAGIDFNTQRVSEKENAEEEGYGKTILAMLFAFLLYFSLLIIGMMVMRAVVEEKSNKIIEVLLSSVSSRELMTGKILGAAITGTMQMAIWLIPVIVVISTSWFTLPSEVTVDIHFSLIVYYLFNYFIAIVTFTGLFAAVGSMFDNDQDAQSGVWPITMLIMIPFFISMTIQKDPDNTIARIASLFPFSSLIVMPGRLTTTNVPLWEFMLSIIISIGTMLVMFPVAAKIYRVGILWTGKKPSFAEVIRWVKYKY